MERLPIIAICNDDRIISRDMHEVQYHFSSIEEICPNVEHAVEYLRSTELRTRLFIIYVRTSEGLSELERLSSTFAGWPILALVEAGYDRSLLLSAQRAGASQVVPLPLYRDDFAAAMERIFEQWVYTAKEVVCVAGVTGGCGTSTIALNLAFQIAKRKYRCILLELSLKLSTLANYLSINPPATVNDLLFEVHNLEPYKVKTAMAKVAENLHVLTCKKSVIDPSAPSAADVTKLINCTRQMADIVVLDLPATFDEIYFTTGAQASEVLLVGEQTVASIRALKMVQSTLIRRGAAGQKRIVVNQFDPNRQGFTTRDVDRVFAPSEVFKVHVDRAVINAANQGELLPQAAPRSRALADIDALAVAVVATCEQPRAKTDRPRLFGLLPRSFGFS